MILINFAHPIDPDDKDNDVLAAIENATGEMLEGAPVEREHNFNIHLPFVDQARSLVDAVGLSPRDWQTASLVVVLPPLSIIAALVLAEIHGRRGSFVRVLRLKRREAGDGFEFAEVIHLQSVRDKAREEARVTDAQS